MLSPFKKQHQNPVSRLHQTRDTPACVKPGEVHSSSYNGCYRLRHHDFPNKGGSVGGTFGVGQTKNVPWWIKNKAESVSYWSS